MQVKRFVSIFLLIFTLIHLVYAKNSFHIQHDSIESTNPAWMGVARLYIKNNNVNVFLNTTKPIPTNTNIVFKMWHRNPRGKYEMTAMPWTGNICHFIKKDKFMYDSMRALKNTELPEKCPIQPGQYYVKDYDVNQITIPIPLSMGQYRMEFRTTSGKTELMKVTWNGKLIPA